MTGLATGLPLKLSATLKGRIRPLTSAPGSRAGEPVDPSRCFSGAALSPFLDPPPP